MPKENKTQYLECSDFTPGLNSLDDPIDIDKGASPAILNMDITKRGKLFSRFGYELVATMPGTSSPMRGAQAYYRTYDDNTGVDNHDDTIGANTYTVPVAPISEAATDKLTFTPSSSTRSRVFRIAFYVVSKGSGDWKVTLHDASNNTLAIKILANSVLVNGQLNYFTIPYAWASGPLHVHVTSTVADGTLKTGTAGDLSTAQPYSEIYRTSNDYLILHCGDGNSYYITNQSSTPTLIGAWGIDNADPVRGTTFLNYAIFSDAGYQSANFTKKWDGTTLSTLSSPQSNIFGVFKKQLFVSGDPDNPSRVNYSDADSLSNINTNFITITNGDGWNVTALVPNADFLQTFKTDTINGINFSFDADYNITAPQQQPIINSQGGVWATDSAQPVYGYTYYMSKKGFEAYGPNPDKVIGNRPLPISLEIEPTFRNINLAAKNSIVSAFFDSKFYCAAPVGATSTANMVFVYNESVRRRFIKDNWTLYNDIPAVGFTLFRNSQQIDELYFISAFEPKVFKFNNTFSDAGNAYVKMWTSKTFKFGERTGYKYIDLEGVMTLGAIITVTLTTDGIPFTDTITKSNLITPALSGSYVGDSSVGGEYIGGGYTGSAVPVYKFKKRIYFPQTINEGYNMNFQCVENQEGQGWGLNRYVVAYEQFPEEPTYARVV